MNRFFVRKLITSVIMIEIIVFFSIKNIMFSYIPITEKINEKNLNIEKLNSFNNINFVDDYINVIDNAVNDNVYDKYKLIESYGYIQKFLNKNEVNNFEVIKDYDNILHYSYFAHEPNAIENIGQMTVDFKNKINNKKIKYIYLMTPDKYVRGKTKIEKGLPYNYANETADNFLNYLGKNNIPYIDLRENLEKNEKTPEQIFYKSDHHWKIESAFDGFKDVVSELEDDYKIVLDKDGFYRDSKNYDFINYPEYFIGSMGRKVGKYYSGIDDFTLILPKFKTSYSVEMVNGADEKSTKGTFYEALINNELIQRSKNYYGESGDKYSSYLYGNQAFVHIKNNTRPQGKKVLFIKDSMAVPLAAFFSLTVSDTYLIDPRYYDKDILQFINNNDLDIVFTSFYPQDLTEEFFNWQS